MGLLHLVRTRVSDLGWLEVHDELAVLHAVKADGYGTDQDALANYVLTSEAVGEPDEFTPALRIHEKLIRALNLIRAGRADEVQEWPDIAALAIGAEALKRRRLSGVRPVPDHQPEYQ